MHLTERHVISENHKLYKEIDKLSFLSKNLYNATLYLVRQDFILNGVYLNYNKIQKTLQNTNNVDYRALPSKIAQKTVEQVHNNFQSYFAALKSYKKDPLRFKAKPRIPKYKHKTDGRATLVYTPQTFSKPQLRKGTIALSGTNIKIKTKVKNPKEVRITKQTYCYIIEVIYNCNQESKNLNQNSKAAIDVGVNNLAALTNNLNLFPLLINGRPLKSDNRYYNKKNAELQSKLPKDQHTSKRIRRLTHKRNNKVFNYLHNASRCIINHLVSNDIGTLVIGYNQDWKQEVNIGKVNNQNFVQIPFLKFVNQLKYKAEIEGIKVITTEESYTSKCSFLDLEEICKHEEYAGRRDNRLFKSKEKKMIHSDVNGSFNIMRKVFPEEFKSKGIEAVVVQPIGIIPYKINQKTYLSKVL